MSLSRGNAWASLSLIAAVNLLVWSWSLANGFVYDDNTILVNNPWVSDFGSLREVFTSSMMAFDPAQPPANTYRPMLYVVYMAEYALFGMKPLGFHALNVLLHTVNAVMVYWVASGLLSGGGKGRALPAFVAALAFSLHTINSEAVNWVSAQAELLFTFFVLLAFLLHMKGPEGRLRPLAALCFLAALLYKETAAAFLLIAILFDYGSGNLARNWRAYVFYGAAVIIYAALRFNAVGGIMHHKQIEFGLYESFVNIFPLVLAYCGKLVYPGNLSAIYEFHPAMSLSDPRALSGVFIAAAFLAAFYFARRRPVFITGLAMLAVPLLPVLYVPALASSAMADRYLYLPSVGLAIILAASLSMLDGRALKASMAVFAAVIIAWAAGSAVRGQAWRSDLTLWQDAVKKAPNAPNAHYNYAWASHNAGRLNDAVEHYRLSARLLPSADAHFNIGVILMNQMMTDEAEAEFRAALSIDPAFNAARAKLIEVQRLKGAGA